MENSKSKKKRSSDADQALAKAGEISPEKAKTKIPSEISPDTIIAEKDEVKNAEERMRQQNKENEHSNDKKD
ncbi:MAG: hypothetical protein WKF68_12960 [Daejeonella sp.]